MTLRLLGSSMAFDDPKEFAAHLVDSFGDKWEDVAISGLRSEVEATWAEVERLTAPVSTPTECQTVGCRRQDTTLVPVTHNGGKQYRCEDHRATVCRHCGAELEWCSPFGEPRATHWMSVVDGSAGCERDRGDDNMAPKYGPHQVSYYRSNVSEFEALMEAARARGHDMRDPRPSSIEPPRGLYATCRTCGRSAWADPDLQGGHGSAPTHGCNA